MNPQEVVIATPLLPDTKTSDGRVVIRAAVPVAQETPPLLFPEMLDRANDFGTVLEVGAF